MIQKPSSCSGCALANHSGGFSLTEGSGKNGVLIVGESLGDKEKFDGLPFRPYAEAGSSLQTALRFLQMDRENFTITNLIRCQPPFNALEGTDYEYQAIEHCKVYLNQVISKFKPKVILALGNLPLKHLGIISPEVLKYMEELKALDSKKYKDYLKNFKISSMRGHIIPSIYGIPLISSLHPSFITREGRIFIGVLMHDIKTAVRLAAGEIPKFKTRYKEKPTVKEAESFYQLCKNNPNLVISHDIETPYTTLETDESEIEFENKEVRDINSIQFSVKEEEGIFFPWFGNYIEIIKKILRLPNPKIGHNSWKFDKTNIEYHLGKNSINGLNIDTMWMFKWLNQDFVKMGRSLQFAVTFAAENFPAWKHLAQLEPENYACLDTDATLRLFNGLKREFQDSQRFKKTQELYKGYPIKSLYEGFIDDVVKLRPILDWTTLNGFPIDPKERLRFKKQIEEERIKVLDQLQDLYPMELRKVTPSEGYKFVPKEVVQVEQLFEKASNFKNDGLFYIVESKDLYELRLAQYLEEHTRIEDKNTTGLVLKEFKINGFKEMRWCRMEEFKPNSREQVVEYLKFKKYKIPKKRNRQTGIEKETTAKNEIYHLAEEVNDPLINGTIYYRELDHLSKTYVGTKTTNKKTGKTKITGWQTASDNRIHAEFQMIPATGQLSTSPNIQNAPKAGNRFSSPGFAKLAKQFRKMVAAGDGKVLLSADYSAFHALTMAFEAEDEDYMRVVRLDPHSFISAHIIKNEVPLRLFKLKKTKPLGMDDLAWKHEVDIGEQTLERIKNLSSWLQLSDEELLGHLKFIKTNYSPVRETQAKAAVHGMGFGMGYRKFYKLNRFTFKNESEPKQILELIQKLFPKTFVNFHEYIKDLAGKQTYLISRYGYIRRFYDVYDWRLMPSYRQPTPKFGEKVIRNSKGWWVRKDGQDANNAIAYLPANHAFGIKKEAMRSLWDYNGENLIKKYSLINEIHDDLLFEIEERLLPEAIPIIRQVMQTPAKYLKNALCPEGLVTMVEMKVGKDWSSMKTI